MSSMDWSFRSSMDWNFRSSMDWCSGMAMAMAMAMVIANEKEETVSFQECIYTAVCTAIALQSIHLFQSLLQQHCILFSPTHPCQYCWAGDSHIS